MRITLMSIGSLGDVRPFVLMGRVLQQRGHQVTLVTFPEFRSLAESYGLSFSPLPSNVTDLMDHLMKPGVSGISYIIELDKAIGRIAPALLDALTASAVNADAMACNFFGSLFYSIAEYYRIPCLQVQFAPVDPTAAWAISSAPFRNAGKHWNVFSYRLGYFLISLLEKRYVNPWRCKNGIRLRSVHTRPDYSCGSHTVPAIYAVSHALMPRPAEWPDNIQIAGQVWDDAPSGPSPLPDALERFLQAGPPPVAIGFGSMSSGNMRAVYSVVSKAVHDAGIRAVILTQGNTDHGLQNDEQLFVADHVPHDSLFPRCCAVVHHGGVGTTVAGLRWGKPTLIIPFGGDQPFWAERIWRSGCGPKPIPRTGLTAKKLTKALQQLTHEPAYAVHAKKQAEIMAAENGAVALADAMESCIKNWQ